MDITINIFPDLLNFSITIATTVVLYLGLRHLLFKPVSEFLRKREAFIEGSLTDAKNLKDEAEVLKDEYQIKLDEANEEARNILTTARKNHDAIVSSAKLDAEKEKRAILDSAEREAEETRQKSLVSLKDDIIEIAISAAKDITNVEADDKTAKRFTDKKIKELGNVTWQK
ncbi:MAG: ATP synthase F0 subunit B [Ezakiella sp.]|nr:ATP synthase F0 subunit B [Ezakiella sp.]MDD7761943.1 ATP synthase F0 subunit B [Bacillota bacterium]MDY3946758.1 ATP synthase F0 subunit B [Ezakiella sp.]